MAQQQFDHVFPARNVDHGFLSLTDNAGKTQVPNGFVMIKSFARKFTRVNKNEFVKVHMVDVCMVSTRSIVLVLSTYPNWI